MRAYAALLGGVLGCADALPVPGTDAHAVSVVEAYLASPEPGLRAMAADLVGRASLRNYADRVTQLLGDPEPRVRAAAVGAQVRLGGPRAAELVGATMRAQPGREAAYLSLLGATRDPEVIRVVLDGAYDAPLAEIRSRALAAAAHVPVELQRALTDRALLDPDPQVRMQAVRLAYAQGRADSLPQLLSALLEGSAERRAEAARLLGDLREYAAVPALMHAAGDPEGVVALVARASLCRLGAPGLCMGLRDAFAVRDAERIEPAIEALVRTGGAAARDLLPSALGHPEATVRGVATCALAAAPPGPLDDLCTTHLDDEDPRARACAAIVALRVAPEKALRVIEAAAYGTNPSLRTAITERLVARHRASPDAHSARGLRALAGLDREDARPETSMDAPLLPLETTLPALEALLAAGDESARRDDAERALASPRPEVRALVSLMVADGRAPDPGPALARATDDPVAAVRLAAAAARLRPTE